MGEMGLIIVICWLFCVLLSMSVDLKIHVVPLDHLMIMRNVHTKQNCKILYLSSNYTRFLEVSLNHLVEQIFYFDNYCWFFFFDIRN